jgi:uncharacterized protein (DUF1697 family)
MSLVVFLRGVNVGGHRRFRPAVLAHELRAMDVVNLGAAGTFVVRKPGSSAQVRAEIARRLPFATDVIICRGSELLRFIASDPFAGCTTDARIVPFVSVLARRSTPASALPLRFPAAGDWGLQVLGQHGRFVFGVYRREMKAISYLSQVDKVFGVPATTRNWRTITQVAAVLERS